MIKDMSVAGVAKSIGAKLVGDDAVFSNLSIDSRAVQKGEAFLALKGERFDGHDFVDAALQSGVSALIVEREVTNEVPQIVVENSHLALANIARLNRRSSKATVLALTGSQGKTTVKEMMHGILSEHGSTLATSANLNNTIGVPLTLLRINPDHQFVVVEMGADCIGEINFSASATEPNIAMITNASPAHIEGFGSLEGIAEGKGEILDSLNESGVAVLNADDEFVARWQQRASHCRAVLFGNSDKADYRATQIETRAGEGVCFELQTPQGSIEITLKLLGEHNAVNASAAAAAAMEAGASLLEVQFGLAKLEPITGRLAQGPGLHESVVIDDTYNASPSSFVAAIDVLAQFKGRRILVAGDMKELGSESDAAHKLVGSHAKLREIEELWVTGEHSSLVVDSYGPAAHQFPSQEKLISHCMAEVKPGDVILVKGSRGAHMENVVSSLQAEESE